MSPLVTDPFDRAFAQVTPPIAIPINYGKAGEKKRLRGCSDLSPSFGTPKLEG